MSYRVEMNSVVIGCLVLGTVAALSFGAVIPEGNATTVETSYGYHQIERNGRITNGENAVEHEFPWQVTIGWRRGAPQFFSHICGGAIIHSEWVLTAAHCRLETAAEYNVRSGKHLINVIEPTQQDAMVQRWIVHPDYVVSNNVGPHDIALLKLVRRLIFNDFVLPVGLPASGAYHTGDAIASGWGSISTTAANVSPIILQKATLPIQSNQVCFDTLHAIVPDPPLESGNICAGSITVAGVSTCRGDSGGPLVQYNENRWELIGIVSWGLFPCGRSMAPSVFVRTSSYMDWIESHVFAPLS